MYRGLDTPHPYHGRAAALATKHHKEQVIGPVLQTTVGLTVFVPDDLDTDCLGTFSGEVERRGTPNEVALRKARLGMAATGLALGLASEGSFGPHPQIPFVAVDHELLAFVDDEIGIEVVEQILSPQTNFAHQAAKTVEDLTEFLTRVDFPSHALIVRPHSGWQPGLLFKGITTVDELRVAVQRCADASGDRLAHVETDMRAHCNPTRQQVLRELALRLGRRLAARCPQCGAPGWGMVDVVRGLPCEWCGGETDLVLREIQGCARCHHRESAPRSDGRHVAAPDYCTWCNP